jgi:uroporphyrinogen decarboxylase
MTSRQRLLATLHGELPDCVPVAPDISNMIPCRLTGRPYWDIYLYQDPPLWKAYLDAAKYFDIDAGIELYTVPPPFEEPQASPWQERIVGHHTAQAPVTRLFHTETGAWHPKVTVYWRDMPPSGNIPPSAVGLPEIPTAWEPVTGVKAWPTGWELWRLVRAEMGEQGICGLPSGCCTCLLGGPDDIYAWYDEPESMRQRARWMMDLVERRMAQYDAMAPADRPDYLICGGSGSLVWQTPAIFRELVLPILKRATQLAADLGIPTHVHSCGPETELVKMAALETQLTVIDPLEIPPMGDCHLAELKRLYGDQIVLKGNLHTTTTMLRGSVDEVVAASRAAIDEAGAGGGFILSTGDQCGRDTPEANLFAMIETARTYGRY